MNGSAISVIIPLYNGERWIEATLRSVLAQTIPPAEIVVVDDGSTDTSTQIVSAIPGVRLLRNPGKGANDARLFGLAQTSAPWIALLDQDDLWHPEHLRLLTEVATRNPDAAAVLGGVIRFCHDEELAYDVAPREPFRIDPWETFPVASVPTPSQAVIRRSALEEVGGWTTAFVGLADYHAWLRLSVVAPLWQVPQITVGYRQHCSSYSAALRSDRQAKFVERWFSAADDVLAWRMRLRVGSFAAYAARLRLARLMYAWLKAPPDTTWSVSTALALNGELALHSSREVAALWGQFFYLLGDAAAGESSAQKGMRLVKTSFRPPWRATRVRGSLYRLALKRLREGATARLSGIWRGRRFSHR